MCFAFLAEKRDVDDLRKKVHEKLRSRWSEVASPRSYIMPLIVLLLVLAFTGRRRLVELARDLIPGPTEGLGVALLLSLALVLWALNKLIQFLGVAKPGLRAACENWSMAVRLSMPFYIALLIATWWLVSFRGIRDDVARTMLLSSLIKDYAVLLIIATVLYCGLFKFVHAGALHDAFDSSRAFLYFMILCGVIALIAIHADYQGLSRAFTANLFTEAWQSKYLIVHVLVRDIVLLLLPIAGLLYTVFRGFARELDTLMSQFDRITQDPAIMDGKACIRGLRVTVGMIISQLGAGHTIEQILADYPYLEREDILQALRYAATLA